MKHFAHSLKSALLLTTVALAWEHAAAQTAAPPPPMIPRTAPPPATTIHATVPVPVIAPRRALTFADLKAQFPQNKDGHLLMEIPSIVNTSTDPEAQTLLAGQHVETTGQVIAETVDNAEGKSLRITRSQLQCCSTHARQSSVVVEFSEKAPVFKEMAWVRLVGTLSYRREERRIVPVITVKEIRETATPINPLLN